MGLGLEPTSDLLEEYKGSKAGEVRHETEYSEISLRSSLPLPATVHLPSSDPPSLVLYSSL